MLCLHYDNVSKTGPAVASPRLQTPMGTLKLRTNGCRGGVRGRGGVWGGGFKGEIKRAVKAPVGSRCVRQMLSASEARRAVRASRGLKDVRAFPDSRALLATRRPWDAPPSSLLDLIISYVLMCRSGFTSAGRAGVLTIIPKRFDPKLRQELEKSTSSERQGRC